MKKLMGLAMAMATVFGAGARAQAPDGPKPLLPMATDADPSFEVATIKPSDPAVSGVGFFVRGRNLTAHNFSLSGLIQFAYGVQGKQVLNLPDWTDKEKYDINAVPDAEGQPSGPQWMTMVQKLLADRFKLTFHRDQREMPVFVVRVAKGGPKNLVEDTSGGLLPTVFCRGTSGGAMVPARNATMKDFSGLLQMTVLDRPVVDQTGLKGRYDFTLKWAPDESQFGGHWPAPSDAADALPGLYTAVEEQLGLKIEPTKAKVEVLVVDTVEKPSPN
jgi:uncharacterized protein (TIGR03435 family)